mgnify:FL=1
MTWKKCKLCGTKYKGHGHNAEPLVKGRCCNTCNYIAVIPARMLQIEQQRKFQEDNI